MKKENTRNQEELVLEDALTPVSYTHLTDRKIKSTDIRSRQINGYYKETGAGAYD